MKWFKHLTASRTDPDIGTIIDRFGYKGYFMFFRTLEIMADEYSTENPAKNDFNFKWFLDQFPRNIDRKTITEFYRFCENNLDKKRIIHKVNGEKIFLNFPKLKHLTDEYTRQKPYRDSDKVTEKVTEKVTPLVTEKVTPKIKDNKNKDKEPCPNTKYSDVDIELSSLLIEGILRNNPRSKVQRMTQQQKESWYNQCRLLREADDWDPNEIRTVIEFCLQDEFEMVNVLSMGKLRERIDNLAMKARRELKKIGERDVGRQRVVP